MLLFTVVAIPVVLVAGYVQLLCSAPPDHGWLRCFHHFLSQKLSWNLTNKFSEETTMNSSKLSVCFFFCSTTYFYGRGLTEVGKNQCPFGTVQHQK